MGKFAEEPEQLASYARLGDQIPFAGLNLRDMDTSIGDGQSPYMPNVNLDDGGKPTKRRGQKYLFTTSKGAGQINGYYEDLFNGRHIYAWGTGLYSYDEDTGTETTLKTGLSNKEGYFYIFNDYLFYKNKVDFLKIDNAFTVTSAIPGAYIPTTFIASPPSGGGTASEQRNLLQAGQKHSFSGTTGTTAYTLPYTNLDATAITAVVNGVAMVETTNFTVNRTTGVVTFNTAPGAGTNNVVVTYYKTITGSADKIINAYRSVLFGGATNDSRVFCCGNDTYKNIYWYTGLTGNTNSDVTYYPEYNFNQIGSSSKYITAWSYLYSSLIALKEDGIYKITYSNVSGVVTFPISILNRQIGCDMPDSVRIIKNYPVFCNTKSGLYSIVNVLASDTEKNVEPIGSLVNLSSNKALIPGILDNTLAKLQDATSLDDGHKYYLCVGNVVYVWDYERSPYNGNTSALIWYYYTNINAKNWAIINREIYYGDRTIGQLIKFQDNKNDFGLAINGVWRSKLFDFGFDMLKTITDAWLSTRANQGSSIVMQFYNDNNEPLITTSVPNNTTNSFDWDNIDWDNWTWDVTRFAPTIRFRPKNKNVIHIQVEISNNVPNENLSILGLVLKYIVVKPVK
ncbi:MAG: hypothetical protein ACM3KR_00680 [Deltaproteobacteria bacterium]